MFIGEWSFLCVCVFFCGYMIECMEGFNLRIGLNIFLLAWLHRRIFLKKRKKFGVEKQFHKYYKFDICITMIDICNEHIQVICTLFLFFLLILVIRRFVIIDFSLDDFFLFSIGSHQTSELYSYRSI